MQSIRFANPVGSRKGSAEPSKALKSVDSQCFFFLPKLQDNAEYYPRTCACRVHTPECTKMYTVTRKPPQPIEIGSVAEIYLKNKGVLGGGNRTLPLAKVSWIQIFNNI